MASEDGGEAAVIGGPFGSSREGALDGLRALAVAAVLAFHSGAGWASGGYLGVSLFFTLSGFLITGLLLADSRRDRRSLVAFWSRRARRLLPAALVTLTAIVVVSGWLDTAARSLPGDVVSALLYVANWRFIIDEQTYADLFTSPSPVLHFWSLAVEEQFYIVFPLLIFGLVKLLPTQRQLGFVLAGLALASSMAPTIFDLSHDRAYYGTDTRAAELLVGAVLATATITGGRFRPMRRWGALPQIGSLACLLALAWSWAAVDQSSELLRRGGLTVHALLACGVILAALQPGSTLQRALRLAPLAWLGRISYGVYLFHWPMFVWLTPARTGLDGPALHTVRVVLSVGLAAMSFMAVEQPALRSKSSVVPATGAVLLASLIGLLLVVAPAPSPSVGVDAAAVSARPPALAGATFVEIAISAEAAAASAPAPPRSQHEQGSDVSEPTVGALVLELTRPEEGLTISDALAIAGSTGDVFDGVEPNLKSTAKAFDYASPAPKVVIFGDSSALMLGFGLGDWGTNTGEAQFLDLASVGCGLSRGGIRTVPNQPNLNKDTACGDWSPAFDSLRRLLQPDAVVFNFGLWEVVDHFLPGDDQWRSAGDPVFDAHLRHEIEAATEIFAASGVPVIWVTSPPFSISDLIPQQSGEPYPSDDQARIANLNAMVREHASQHPLVGLVELDAWFDSYPGGPFDPHLRPDGVHVTLESSAIVGNWLGPEIMAELDRLVVADG